MQRVLWRAGMRSLTSLAMVRHRGSSDAAAALVCKYGPLLLDATSPVKCGCMCSLL